jgi:uncharacterized protein (DUF433 family)
MDSHALRSYALVSRMKQAKPKANLIETPNYSIQEAALYLHVPVQTLRYWIVGTHDEKPLIEIAERRPQQLLSFQNLIECYVVEAIREIHNVHVSRIRYAIEKALQLFPSRHPLADYQLRTMEDAIFIEFGGELINLTRGGQGAFRPILEAFLRRVDRDEQGIARRLYPFTRKTQLEQRAASPRVVVIDPDVAFGMPVLASSRISTAFLASRYRGGDPIGRLAQDYGREESEIEEALIWEKAKSAA